MNAPLLLRAARRSIADEVVQGMGPLRGRSRIWVWLLVALVAWGLVAYVYQLVHGLAVTAMRDYVSWGLYMANFVFFIGISHAGTLISAILRVTHAEWRRPITRMAEAITVFALIVGASMVLIDMGRVDRVWHVLRYGRLQSPILWDVCSIVTYLCGSVLYLYVAMIPDLALMAELGEQGRFGPRRTRFYRWLSLGFKGTPEQTRRLDIALATMAVIIIPVAVSVHTVVSWIFGMTLRPGWHSTIFGPYFVIGAIFSGTAAIILAMAIFRKVSHLEKYITFLHFRRLGTLLLALTIIYMYFTLAEYLTDWYGGISAEKRLIDLLMGGGEYTVVFWLMVGACLVLPAVLLAVPGKNTMPLIVTASALALFGAWVKRYLIMVPTMQTPFIPAEAAGSAVVYFPTWVEWSITVGATAFFVLLYVGFAKVFPILSITEIAEPLEAAQEAAHAPGSAQVAGGTAP
jgi:molybdopterin-containing oxidoreductase family membrane subunit